MYVEHVNDDDDTSGVDGIDADPAEDEAGVFASLKLDGVRFNGGRLPIDALVELQRYRELILAAAKQAWREENPDEEIPEDFSTAFDLAVTEIEAGSAIPVMERRHSAYDSFYDIGRNEIETLFADIVNRNFGAHIPIHEVAGPDELAEFVASGDLQNFATPDDRPKEVTVEVDDAAEGQKFRLLSSLAPLDAFRNFGSSLQDEDSLILSGTESHEEVRITAETAPRLLRPIFEQMSFDSALQAEEVLERHKKVSTVAGRLIALNADARNFKIKTLLFDQVHGRYQNPERLEDLKKVLESSSQAPLIRITGRMSWLGDNLTQILGVDNVELLEIEEEPWSRRIVELASLSQNWHPELDKSPLISFGAIDAAREVLRETKQYELQAGIYPNEDGGVTVEWGSPRQVITLEITPDLDFFLFHLDAASGIADEVDLENLSEVIERVQEALS